MGGHRKNCMGRLEPWVLVLALSLISFGILSASLALLGLRCPHVYNEVQVGGL